MIEAGRYDLHSMRFAFDCFSSSKEENKPKKTGREEKEIVLFRFADPKPLDEVIAELERAGYRPAELEDLLALGATYPNLQRRFPIMALGSIFTSPDGQRWAPCISREGDNRICSLCGLKGGLPHPRWRFAAVPKSA